VRPSAPPGPSAASGNVSAERRPALQIMTSFTAIVCMGLLAMAVAFPIGLKAPSAAVLDIQNFVAAPTTLCAFAAPPCFPRPTVAARARWGMHTRRARPDA
jgi:hypothetical protein